MKCHASQISCAVRLKMRSLTYFKVCAEGAEDDGRFLLVGEEEHFRSAWVIFLENIMVCGCNWEHSVADMLEGHLLDDVSVELFIATLMVLRRHWKRWVDAIRGELCDSLLGADS